MVFPMKRLAWLALAISSPATAAPTYLSCLIDNDGIPVRVELTMDEPNSEVTIFMPHSGHTRRVRAVFSPSDVRFAQGDVKFYVNRVDLTLRRLWATIGMDNSGKCEVGAIPKRAF